MIEITDALAISESEIKTTFIRSPGPGGQNVNKVATAAQLRFDAAQSPNVSEDVFERLTRLAGTRMTKDGVIVLTASRFRSQERNRQARRRTHLRRPLYWLRHNPRRDRCRHRQTWPDS